MKYPLLLIAASSLLTGCATHKQDVESLSTFELCYEQAYKSEALFDGDNYEARQDEIQRRRKNGNYHFPSECAIGRAKGKEALSDLKTNAAMSALLLD